MIPLSLEHIAVATGGRLLDADPEHVADSLVVDSRQIRPGAIFAALPGERVDGARFVTQVVREGAAVVLVPREHPDSASWAEQKVPRIEVADVQTALGHVARAVRLRSRAQVVGVTGSSGKTSTKDMLAAVLSPHRRTVANEKSFNNEVGLPLTLSRISSDTQIAVLEMGTAGAGQIAELCDIALPDVGVVTIVGMSHFEQFGNSQDAIAVEKSALVRALPPEGLAVLNADDERVLAMRLQVACRVLTYGVHNEDADVRATGVRLDADGRPSFTLHLPEGTAPVDLPATGEHMVVNALAAAAVATGLGLTVTEIAQGLASFTLSPGRMQTSERADGVRVIDDSYNANPVSVEAGLRALVASRREGGRAVVVLGEMADLADLADEAHRAIGRLAASLGVDLFVAVGARPELAAAAAREAGLEHTLVLDKPQEVAAALAPLLEPADVVLLKGSRSAGLEVAAQALAGTTPESAPEESGKVGAA
ncbi:UDP-N-acetylmuramoyl-tripeptide--D-alanyl-D-alanine ligase [Kineosporia succinea]|uniref:UDP-N-acetylmuramoyl-tripeptide--D-alanyl-D-alanine ligase n=1 Tax=Kineosporia succinea TaxID=84632 RepID=A0ABT9PDG4_9ACTN|nr:UDP-N-acetylmuramoyl-tripeptide--D-alanyl-D-alanine ligase [Kineosporia succinea]MDP9830756.1 UDP-N-acetylmuramoyl-tripeptide--D-alanyl-D-alanine ligase [Kineosporia succinea]